MLTGIVGRKVGCHMSRLLLLRSSMVVEGAER